MPITARQYTFHLAGKMKTQEKIEAYFEKEQPFREGICLLRELAHKTGLIETYKWGIPVYTIDNKNVLGKGLVLAPEKNKPISMPPLLKKALNNNQALKANYESLTPYKQREYCEYISQAKQEKTKQSRLEKCISLLEKGMGLHDKYRKG